MLLVRAVGKFFVVAIVSVTFSLWAARLPDSNSIAFERTRNGNTDIYLLDMRVRLVYNVTRHPATDRLPSWSPGGRYLAFQSRRDEDDNIENIYVLDLFHPQQVQRLLPSGMSGLHPAWSSSGCCIAFSMYDSVYWSNNIFVFDLQTGHIENATPQVGMQQYLPAWSPDDRYIAFQGFFIGELGNQHIYIAPIHERHLSEQKQLPETTLFQISESGGAAQPSWSPDGKHMVFINNRMFANLFETTTQAESKDRHISPDLRFVEYPSYSPDGRWIAYSASENPGADNRSLYLTDRNGKNIHQLTFPVDPFTVDSVPRWRP